MFLLLLSFICRLVKYYVINNTSFNVHDVVSMVESGEWDRVDICLELPNDHDLESAEDSSD